MAFRGVIHPQFTPPNEIKNVVIIEAKLRLVSPNLHLISPLNRSTKSVI